MVKRVREWVSDRYLMPIQQLFSHVIARTSWFSIRWWRGTRCTRPIRWVIYGFWLPIWYFQTFLRKFMSSDLVTCVRMASWVVVWLYYYPTPFLSKVDFQLDDDEVPVVLDQYAGLVYHSASSSKQLSAARRVDPSGHIILILSQPVFGLSP
jgi:hypothetical protein